MTTRVLGCRCSRCDYGLTTRDDASSQVAASNCTLAPGFGFHDNAVVPCPIGELGVLEIPLRVDSSTVLCMCACAVGGHQPLYFDMLCHQPHTQK